MRVSQPLARSPRLFLLLILPFSEIRHVTTYLVKRINRSRERQYRKLAFSGTIQDPLSCSPRILEVSLPSFPRLSVAALLLVVLVMVVFTTAEGLFKRENSCTRGRDPDTLVKSYWILI